MTDTNWQKIERAPKGTSVLLRIADLSAPPLLGHQDQEARWWAAPGVEMVQPLPAFFCLIPQFDCEAGI